MKKLLIACLTFLLLCAAVNAYALSAAVQAAVSVSSTAPSCTSCNSGTDSEIVDDGNTADDYTGATSWRAKTFTTATTICVTGVFADVGDSGANLDVTAEIYTDSSGKPGSIVAAGYTGTYENVPNTHVVVEITFSACQTLAAGTYWIVLKPSGTINFGRQTTGGAGTFKYSSDSGSTWTDSSLKLVFGVLGCNPS